MTSNNFLGGGEPPLERVVRDGFLEEVDQINEMESDGEKGTERPQKNREASWASAKALRSK